MSEEDLLTKLYELLISPVMDKVPAGRRILISPAATLWNVPWCGLLDAKGSFLIESHEIAIVTTPREMLMPRPSKPLEIKSPCVVADLNYGNGNVYKPLKGTAKDRDAFLSVFSADMPRDFRQGNCTRSDLLSAMSQTSCFLMATHGSVIRPEQPDLDDPFTFPRFALSFANQGLENCLTARDILSCDLSGMDVAFLSCCNSSAGMISAGELPLSPAYAFQVAGCREVVASIWPVLDDETATIQMDFWKDYNESGDAVAALRNAQKKFIENCRRNGGSTSVHRWGAWYAMSGPR